jgi:hypothetical protein
MFIYVSILIFSSLHGTLAAQKEDFKWLLGGGIGSPDSVFKSCLLDFSNGAPVITQINKDLPYIRTNTSICDADGNLLCYSNGDNIYNRNYQVMENGSAFYGGNEIQGFPGIQSYLLLPLPGSSNKVVYIYGDPEIITLPSGTDAGYIKFESALIDMNLNNGLGKVVQREIVAATDSLIVGQITATRHGNGRDWWIVVPRYQGNVIYKYLLTPLGLSSSGSQIIPVTPIGIGQAVFSPDGQWYARFNDYGFTDDSYSTFDLYRFDRCAGLLSNRISKTYSTNPLDGKDGGIAFSNSSRYLYVSRWDSIFQYDTQAPDILTSEVVVASYDGFSGEYNQPTRFYSLQLAPDNKIYCCVANSNSRYLHVIEQPDSVGLACNVKQHAIHLPVFNNFLLPNLPYYRLDKWEDSPCDTLSSVGVHDVNALGQDITLSPNPANNTVRISFGGEIKTECQILLLDLTGRIVATQSAGAGSSQESLSLEKCQSGMYVVQIREDGRPVAQQKLTVIR